MMNLKQFLLASNLLGMLFILNGCAQPQYVPQYDTVKSNPSYPTRTLEQQYEEAQKKAAQEKAKEENEKLKLKNTKLYGEHYNCSDEKISLDLYFNNGNVVTTGREMSDYKEEGIYKRWTMLTIANNGEIFYENAEFNSDKEIYTLATEISGREIRSYGLGPMRFIRQYKCKRIK